MNDDCYQCERLLQRGHDSWFCSEECRKQYWQEANVKRKYNTTEQLMEKIQEMKEYARAHPQTDH